MYSYAKQQRLDILKMEFRQAYFDWQDRIAKENERGAARVRELDEQYQSRLRVMQSDREDVFRLHIRTMQNINAQLDRVTAQLQEATALEGKARAPGGRP